MKAGNKFLLRLRDSAPDFLGNICDDGDVFFPAEIFGGAAKITERDLLERIFKEDEKEVNVAVCRDGFQVVVSSNALLENFAAQLGQSIPLSKCQAYAVEKNA